MNSINIKAIRWSGGWELWDTDADECLTQVSRLSDARQQVVDYLDTVDESVDHSDWDIQIKPDLGEIGEQIVESRQAVAEAAKAQELAALKTRRAVKAAMSMGITQTDCAMIMGISKSRVSQLAN